MIEYEKIVMNIIAYSGESETLSNQAFDLALEGNISEAESNLSLSKEKLNKAGKYHFDLLQMEANDEEFRPTLLMIHAMDHFVLAQNKLENAECIIKLIKSTK